MQTNRILDSLVADKYGANPLIVINFDSSATKKVMQAIKCHFTPINWSKFRFDWHGPKNIEITLKNQSSDAAPTEFESRKTITMQIEDKLTISGVEIVPSKLIQKLRGRTYCKYLYTLIRHSRLRLSLVDTRELMELFKTFKLAALEHNELTPETFFTLFPDMQDEQVKLALFHAFDSMQQPTGSVSFEKFARALSVISRGSTSEKALVAFLVFDLDRVGAVNAMHVRQVAKESSRVLQE